MEGNTPGIQGELDFDAQLRSLARMRDELEAMKAQKSELQKEYDELSFRLAMYMDQTGTGSKKLDDINFIKTQRTFAKVEDKAALAEWIKENAAEDLLMAVHAQKVVGYCNECLENGTDIPPGINPGYIKHSVSIRRM